VPPRKGFLERSFGCLGVGGASTAHFPGHHDGMDNQTRVTETKETTIEKRTVREEPPVVEVPEPRRGETVTIETHTED
jgi:hypothetical protein